MSANLMGNPGAVHDFIDDLESSLYVLLWTIVMYSKVSDPDMVPSFLSGVLDPLPCNSRGGVTKKDFLKGQSFLQEVKYPGREKLSDLIIGLAGLFQVRYGKTPTKDEREEYHELLSVLQDNPALQDAYAKNSFCQQYDDGLAKLKNYDATIALFDTALSDRSEWPDNDPPNKQPYGSMAQPGYFIKSGWGTTGIEKAQTK